MGGGDEMKRQRQTAFNCADVHKEQYNGGAEGLRPYKHPLDFSRINQKTKGQSK
jgi:hypothetical protein